MEHSAPVNIRDKEDKERILWSRMGQAGSKTKTIGFLLRFCAPNIHLRSTGELTLHEEVEVGSGELLMDGL